MSAPKQIRSFIAVPLTDPVKASIKTVQDRLRPLLPETRWSRPESMHLTLHFFGDIDEESLEKAGSVMVSVGSLFSPFSVRLVEVGAFPSVDRARVIWLGVQGDELAELHAALTGRLKRAGFPGETRRFSPHITLGRSRSGTLKARHILSQEGGTVAGEMTVDSLVLYESVLTPQGGVHRPRQTVHLTAD